MSLPWLQLAPSIQEVYELAGTLLTHLDELESLSVAWVQGKDQVDHQVSLGPEADQVLLPDLFRAQVRQQTQLFDVLEALLAAWARLSLLLFPLVADRADFRRARGEHIRRSLRLDETSVFSDRHLRDAWMHFDERLDAAVSSGRFGNRQAFVRSGRAAEHFDTTLRLVEVDTLVVHYPDRSGNRRTTDIRRAREELVRIRESAAQAG